MSSPAVPDRPPVFCPVLFMLHWQPYRGSEYDVVRPVQVDRNSV